MSNDWIKVGTGVALILPFAFVSLSVWRDSRDDGMSFSEFAWAAFLLVGSVSLFLALAILAGRGVFMILEAFQ